MQYTQPVPVSTPPVSDMHNSVALTRHIHRNMHFACSRPLSVSRLHTSPSYSMRCDSGSISSDILHHENIAVRSNPTPPRDFSSHTIHFNWSYYRSRRISAVN